MTTLKLSRTSPARTARTRGLGAWIADRVRALTRYCRAASPSPTERTITILDDVCELRPRNWGKTAHMAAADAYERAYGGRPNVLMIPAALLKPDHVEAGDRESNRIELGIYARIEAQRRALAQTGLLKRSVRIGENAGINALTGELTAWIPEPEEAEFEQEWPAKWEPKGLLEHQEDDDE